MRKTKNRYKKCESKSKKREFGEYEVSPLYNFNKNFTELQCFAPKLRNNFNIQKRILFPFKCLSMLRVAII